MCKRGETLVETPDFKQHRTFYDKGLLGEKRLAAIYLFKAEVGAAGQSGRKMGLSYFTIFV